MSHVPWPTISLTTRWEINDCEYNAPCWLYKMCCALGQNTYVHMYVCTLSYVLSTEVCPPAQSRTLWCHSRGAVMDCACACVFRTCTSTTKFQVSKDSSVRYMFVTDEHLCMLFTPASLKWHVLYTLYIHTQHWRLETHTGREENGNWSEMQTLVVNQSRTSGCLVTSECYRPSAANEEWYSPKRPSYRWLVHRGTVRTYVPFLTSMYISFQLDRITLSCLLSAFRGNRWHSLGCALCGTGWRFHSTTVDVDCTYLATVTLQGLV